MFLLDTCGSFNRGKGTESVSPAEAWLQGGGGVNLHGVLKGWAIAWPSARLGTPRHASARLGTRALPLLVLGREGKLESPLQTIQQVVSFQGIPRLIPESRSWSFPTEHQQVFGLILWMVSRNP